MQNKKFQLTVIFTLILAIFTLQTGLVWASEELGQINTYNNNISKEEATRMINNAHQEVDALKGRLLSQSHNETEKYLAYKLATDFHGKINSYYGDDTINTPSQNLAQSFNNPVSGGSSSGSGASSSGSSSGSGASSSFSPVSNSGIGAASGLSGINGMLNGANGSSGSSSGSGATSSSSGSSSGLSGILGNLLGSGSSSSNSSSSSGIGGFFNNIFSNLFNGSGVMGTVGNVLNTVLGAGSTSSISNLINNVKSLMQNGITSNGSFSFKLFLFNTIWNLVSKWLLSKVTSFIQSMATKLQGMVNNLINKIPTNLPLVGGLLTSLKTKAQNAVNGLISSLQTKALTFVQDLLNKAKTAIKNKLGI